MMTTIRKAEIRDVPVIARIHRRAFQSFFLTRLGPSFLRKYYKAVHRYPQGILLVVESDSGIVAGFCAGFIDPVRFYALLKKKRWVLAISVIPALLRTPGILFRLSSRYSTVRASAHRESSSPEVLCELSSIGIDPRISSQGYGRLLLQEFLEEARKEGAREVYLTTDAAENDRVNAFYQAAGFKLREVQIQSPTRSLNKYIFRFPE